MRPALAGETACAAQRHFANPEMLSSMRRGVNLSTWRRKDGGPTLAQLQALRDAGFTHIRLPIDNALLTGEDQTAYLDDIYEEVVLLLSLGYSVSIDLHPDSTVRTLFERDPREGEAYLIAIWQAVAKRLRTFDPARVAFELLNEPEIGPEEWRDAAGRLIAAIRPIVPDSTIIVGPSWAQRHEALDGMKAFDDSNIVYAVHYYDPFAFTHQGADWQGAGDQLRFLRDLPFPAEANDAVMQARIAELEHAGHAEAAEILRRSLQTPWTEREIAAAFDVMQRWSDQNDRPVVVNEFGVLAHVAPRRSRLDWLATVRGQAESRCIGWVHWDFQDGFGLIDPATGRPDAGVIEALIPRAD